ALPPDGGRCDDGRSMYCHGAPERRMGAGLLWESGDLSRALYRTDRERATLVGRSLQHLAARARTVRDLGRTLRQAVSRSDDSRHAYALRRWVDERRSARADRR